MCLCSFARFSIKIPCVCYSVNFQLERGECEALRSESRGKVKLRDLRIEGKCEALRSENRGKV